MPCRKPDPSIPRGTPGFIYLFIIISCFVFRVSKKILWVLRDLKIGGLNWVRLFFLRAILVLFLFAATAKVRKSILIYVNLMNIGYIWRFKVGKVLL